jgi:hypothetical protein
LRIAASSPRAAVAAKTAASMIAKTRLPNILAPAPDLKTILSVVFSFDVTSQVGQDDPCADFAETTPTTV